MKKTAIISIPDGIVSSTVKKLRENVIACNYMGIDQSGRIIMQVRYEPDKEQFIQSIHKHILETEKTISEIMQGFNQALEQLIKETKSK